MGQSVIFAQTNVSEVSTSSSVVELRLFLLILLLFASILSSNSVLSLVALGSIGLLDVVFTSFNSAETVSAYLQTTSWVLVLEFCLFLGLLSTSWVLGISTSGMFQ
jgi:hypothetical protein